MIMKKKSFAGLLFIYDDIMSCCSIIGPIDSNSWPKVMYFQSMKMGVAPSRGHTKQEARQSAAKVRSRRLGHLTFSSSRPGHPRQAEGSPGLRQGPGRTACHPGPGLQDPLSVRWRDPRQPGGDSAGALHVQKVAAAGVRAVSRGGSPARANVHHPLRDRGGAVDWWPGVINIFRESTRRPGPARARSSPRDRRPIRWSSGWKTFPWRMRTRSRTSMTTNWLKVEDRETCWSERL